MAEFELALIIILGFIGIGVWGIWDAISRLKDVKK
jgi:hypothetical protein